MEPLVPVALLKKSIVSGFPDFPELAWRGIFADYRDAMAGTTEACAAAHFGALWATVAATLGRSVHLYIGNNIYPNVFLIHHGESTDKKTTAHRRPGEHLLVRVARDHRAWKSRGIC
jgi:hypothetical protein